MKKDAKKTPPREGRKPFFARLLEAQELEQAAGGKSFATRKYPSDSEDTAVTEKFPSDSDEVAVTLKYPSDAEDGGGGCSY